MKITNYKSITLLILVLLSLFLVACGGGGEDAPEPTADAPEANTDNAGAGSPDSPISPNMTPVNTPFVPSGDTSPFGDAIGGPGGSVDSGEEPVTDFSTLQPGQQVFIQGEITAVEDGVLGEGVIRDEQGNGIRLILPLPRLGDLDGQVTNLRGLLTSPETEGGLPSLSNPIVVADLLALDNTTPPFLLGEAPPPAQDTENDTGSAPSFAPGDAPFMTLQAPETLSISLSANATALGAYDGLMAAIPDQLEGLNWLSAEGSRAQGWRLLFNNPAGNTNITYIISPEGAIERVSSLGAPVPGFNNPIDRAQVVVDSDIVEAQLAVSESVLDPTLILLSTANGIEWHSTVGESSFVLDATTPR